MVKPPKMHPGEVETDAALVRRLVGAQFPQWAHLAIEPIASAGTDNAIYRLGRDLAVRLPRIDWAVGQVDRELEWLPRLAPKLSLTVPIPVAVGGPAFGYPWSWGIWPWTEGEQATAETLDDLGAAARDLAGFLSALHAIDPAGGPPASRGGPLSDRDQGVRAAIGSLGDEFDGDAVLAAWDAALETPSWDSAAVWMHGDAYDGNLLARDGRLTAVIDWSGVGIGDPSADVIVAWSLFSGDSRDAFRSASRVDDATWARGRGWALAVAVNAIPYYRDTNRVLAANARHRLREVLADLERD
jgi:aminoglycoside phosphotransferase (APT) family kinase protein